MHPYADTARAHENNRMQNKGGQQCKKANILFFPCHITLRVQSAHKAVIEQQLLTANLLYKFAL